MKTMLRKWLLVLLPGLFLTLTLFPPIAFADTSITGKTDCPAGSTTVDPSGQQTFGATADAAKDIQNYIYKVESCASACFDENVDVRVNVNLLTASTVTVVTKATNQCAATPVSQPSKAQPPRGCSASQTQPQITLEVPDISMLGTTYLKQQTIGPKSRCFGAVATTVSSLTQGGISKNTNPAAIQSNFDALASLGTQAPVTSQAGTIAGNSQLISALTSSGLNENDAQKIASDPVSAQALINAYATGNKDTIQDTVQDAAAKAGITLNDGVYDNIASLSDSKVADAKSTLTPLADQSGTGVPPGNTFAQPASGGQPDRSLSSGNVCGYPGIAGMMMNSETRCGSLQAPPGQKAQGPLQYQCATWQAYTAATGHSDWSDCGNRYDPNKAVQVTNDYYQNVWAPQNAAACAAANISLASCAYTSHWLGTGGGPRLVQALPGLDTSAPITSLCGTALLSQADCAQNPGLIYADPKTRTQPYTIGGVFQNMDKLLGVNNSAAPTTYAGNQSTSIFSSIAGTGYGNDSGYNGYNGVSSPFANVSPIYSTPGLGSNSAPQYQPQYTQQYPQQYNQYPPPYAQQYTQPVQQPVQQPVPVQQPQQPASTGSTHPLVSPGKNGLAVDQIIAQPKTVSRGRPIIVSWSSVGMSSTSPCSVLENGSVISSSMNEGFKIVTTATAGTYAFSLSCTARSSGTVVKSSSSVVVQ